MPFEPPIGAALEAEEVEAGLRIVGQLNIDDNARAREVYAAMKNLGGDGRPPLREFSFAFFVMESHWVTEEEQEIRELADLELIEVGPTLMGANPATELLDVASGAVNGRPSRRWELTPVATAMAELAQVEIEAKAGAVLSATNRGHLEAARDQIETVLKAAEKDDDDKTGAKSDDPQVRSGARSEGSRSPIRIPARPGYPSEGGKNVQDTIAKQIKQELDAKRAAAAEAWQKFAAKREEGNKAGVDWAADEKAFHELHQLNAEYSAIANEVEALQDRWAKAVDMDGGGGPSPTLGLDDTEQRAAASGIWTPGLRVVQNETYKTLAESGELMKKSGVPAPVDRGLQPRRDEGRPVRQGADHGRLDTSGGAFVETDRQGYYPGLLRLTMVRNLVTVGDTDSDLVEWQAR